MSRAANPVTVPLAEYSPRHFLLSVADGVATVTLNRPERKNPLTFESYRELTDFFRACAFDDTVKAVVVTGAGGNFSSGGDVFEIIGPLIEMDTVHLLEFTLLDMRAAAEICGLRQRTGRPIEAAKVLLDLGDHGAMLDRARGRNHDIRRAIIPREIGAQFAAVE